MLLEWFVFSRLAQGQLGLENVMIAEYDSLMKNNTWNLVPYPQEKNVVKWQWVTQTKFTSQDVVENHKACLVAKRFSQQEGIDYTETFSFIAKMNYILLIRSLVAHFGW